MQKNEILKYLEISEEYWQYFTDKAVEIVWEKFKSKYLLKIENKKPLEHIFMDEVTFKKYEIKTYKGKIFVCALYNYFLKWLKYNEIDHYQIIKKKFKMSIENYTSQTTKRINIKSETKLGFKIFNDKFISEKFVRKRYEIKKRDYSQIYSRMPKLENSIITTFKSLSVDMNKNIPKNLIDIDIICKEKINNTNQEYSKLMLTLYLDWINLYGDRCYKKVKHKQFFLGFIYKIYNIVNDKIYIGSSCNNFYHRLGGHFYYSKKNKSKFYKAIKTLGTDKFRISLLTCCYVQDISELKKREDYFIEYYNSIENGYNERVAKMNSKHRMEQKIKQDDKRKRKYNEEGKNKKKQYYKQNKDLILDKIKKKYHIKKLRDIEAYLINGKENISFKITNCSINTIKDYTISNDNSKNNLIIYTIINNHDKRFCCYSTNDHIIKVIKNELSEYQTGGKSILTKFISQTDKINLNVKIEKNINVIEKNKVEKWINYFTDLYKSKHFKLLKESYRQDINQLFNNNKSYNVDKNNNNILKLPFLSL